MRDLFLACVLGGAGFVLSSCGTDAALPAHNSHTFPETPATISASEHPRMTTMTAQGLPGYVDCVGSPRERPQQLSLRCSDDSRILTDIAWQEWTDRQATGIATLERTPKDGFAERLEGVEVELNQPVETPQGLAFTQILVNGTAEQP